MANLIALQIESVIYNKNSTLRVKISAQKWFKIKKWFKIENVVTIPSNYSLESKYSFSEKKLVTRIIQGHHEE